MGDLRRALRVENGAKDVGDVSKSDNAMLLGEHLLRSVEVDLSLASERNCIDLISGKLPGNDVAVVLEVREQHSVAALLRKRAGDEVDRLGGAAREDELVRLPADEVRRGGAGALIGVGHGGGTLVHAAV